MAFTLETEIAAKKIAQVVTTSTNERVYFPMENIGNSARKISSLFVTFDYTRTVDLELQFKVVLKGIPGKEFLILSATNPAEAYKVKITSTSRIIVPLPIPFRADAVFIEPITAAPFGACVVGFASDEGIISPRF